MGCYRQVKSRLSATNQKPTPTLSSHDRILEAAKRLFATHGYENTSTVAIARGAGTSESQLMKHFGSKQGLLVAIFDRGWASISERLRAGHPSSPADRLAETMEAIAVELEGDPDLKVLMSLEGRRVRKDSTDVVMSRGFRQFIERIDTILAEMRRAGQIRSDLNLDAVRAAYLGMMEGLLRDQVVASRSQLRASYDLEDVRRVLELLIPAFGERRSQTANV